MSMPSIHVFTPLTTQRLSLQNRVVRRLRELGCTVLATTLDSHLTIQVEPAAAPVLRLQKGGSLTRRSERADVVSVEIDGCCVTWKEVKA